MILNFDEHETIIIFEEYDEIIKDIDGIIQILNDQGSEIRSLISVIRCNNRLFFTYMTNPTETGQADLFTWIFFERKFTKFSKKKKLAALEYSWINHYRIQYTDYYKVFKDKEKEILIDNGNITFYV